MSNKTKHITLTAEVAKAANGDEWWTASTGDLDRENDRVDQSGWDLTAYKKNPLLLWGHDYVNPHSIIGRAKDIRVENGKLILKPEWRRPASASDPMHVVRSLIDSGMVRALSVGFRPLEQGQRNESGGVDYGRVELYEVSVVSVPANSAAVRGALEAVAKGLASGGQDDDDELTPEQEQAIADALIPLLDEIAHSYGVNLEL